jgi:dTMP kinase
MAGQRGFLVSIEGGEGAGKSTVREALHEVLAGHGLEVVSTREPGGTDAGESIRSLLLDPSGRLFPETELLLMFASRAQLVRELILPAIERGAAVLTDRFTDASFAYQGGGRGIAMATVAELERWAALIKPDLTFLLDVDVEVGMARARSRGVELDRIESEQLDFFERVRASYLARAAAEPQRFRHVDASQPPATVRENVQAMLRDWLAAR